ncbi:RsbRD N-terminal domain-containing protein [Novilysobacter erysipheiresistens]|uniref:RsbRD N-terminal domain-containing protein n=1 Tax=Novilysobacter erysipheiresistens TaxID=1749332 RepID=A0ABU7YXV8_9GAMM
MNKPDEPLPAACSRLAEYLQSHKDQVIREWITSVRWDPSVPSEALTKPEITDHLPNIFDAIVQAIRDECSNANVDQVQHLAARHTIVRWVQNYDLKAVLRELSLLRAGLIHHLSAFEDHAPDFGNEARRFTSTIVHRVLDDIVMDATQTYFGLKTQSDENGA